MTKKQARRIISKMFDVPISKIGDVLIEETDEKGIHHVDVKWKKKPTVENIKVILTVERLDDEESDNQDISL